MKVAVVAQRYGRAVSGGAEAHARYVAEHLAKHVTVEVLTTCATDYITWRNELPAGLEQVNGLPVRRFKVRHERNPVTFGKRQEWVFDHRHSIGDELDWLDAEGPASPALIDHLSSHRDDYDYCVFFSYRYFHAYHGVRATVDRAILVPTAERDETIGLSIFPAIFRSVRALMYNSPEERRMIQAVSGNDEVPGVVVGVGSEVPPDPQAARFRQKHGLRGPFAIYVGRIDENKGCPELFDFFQSYLERPDAALTLVLVGASMLPIPSHPRIKHLGFLDDVEKFDGMTAADVLVMPSYYESLSMVALEAWALGKPVLANGKCEVLKGQCIRSNAGLYYQSRGEFVEALSALERNRWLSAALGRNGRQFYRDFYDWPVIERKYLDMFDRLARDGAARQMEPLPGWRERRRQNLPPARQVLEALPRGPVIGALASGPSTSQANRRPA